MGDRQLAGGAVGTAQHRATTDHDGDGRGGAGHLPGAAPVSEPVAAAADLVGGQGGEVVLGGTLQGVEQVAMVGSLLSGAGIVQQDGERGPAPGQAGLDGAVGRIGLGRHGGHAQVAEVVQHQRPALVERQPGQRGQERDAVGVGAGDRPLGLERTVGRPASYDGAAPAAHGQPVGGGAYPGLGVLGAVQLA